MLTFLFKKDKERGVALLDKHSVVRNTTKAKRLLWGNDTHYNDQRVSIVNDKEA
ncbi:MAG: hypothetical protein WCT32_05280 [Patescibacteria group bacterium]|jgi:hypothetical protein